MILRSFHLDKRAGKMLGVCSGIAASTGTDPLLVRLGVVILTIAVLGKWGVVAYLVAGVCAPDRPRDS